MERTDPQTCRTSARLALADHMNRFKPAIGAPSSPEGVAKLTFETVLSFGLPRSLDLRLKSLT
jgi:hypothetical protein